MSSRTLTADTLQHGVLLKDNRRPETIPVTPTAPAKAGSRRTRILLIGVPALILVIAGLSLWLSHAAKFEDTDDAFVEADVHPISSRIVGDIQEVLVTDNQIVTKGQPLAKLDPRDYQMKLQAAQTALEQATAQIPQAEAALTQARAASRQADAQVEASAAQLEKARMDFDRAEKLRSNAGQAISRQDFDAMKAAFASATATHTATFASRDAAHAGVSTAEANLSVAKAGRDHAQAAVDDAQLQLSYTVLRAPEDGRIGKRTLQTGQHVQPGQALLAVVSTDNWVVANFKENQLSHMRAGQSVDITIDSIRGHHFTGHVDSFSPGTGAKFTLLPPDNATGNFTKVVQRLPVKILLNAEDSKAYADRISPGLSVIATVRVKS